MRLPRCLLYFALELLVCCAWSAEAGTIVPIRRYSQTQTIPPWQYFPGTLDYCAARMGGCICKVTFCPSLCRISPLGPSTQQCTFLSNCHGRYGQPIQCVPQPTGITICVSECPPLVASLHHGRLKMEPMTADQAATLKRLAEAAYQREAFKPNLTRAEADVRTATLTAKLKLLGGPPHTL
jgi:hypothetical protein